MSILDLLSVFDRLRRPASKRDEGYKRLHPKDNFYQSVAFFPMPFALITTVNEAGLTSIGPYSLCFPFELIEEPSMMLVARAGSNTSANLRRGSKAALHFVEFKKNWLKSIVHLGYPGFEPAEKMKNIPFEMTRSPTETYASDPEFPLIIKDAFQVFECELDGTFSYKPERETAPMSSENFWCLKIKNVLLKDSVYEKLVGQKVFPNIPISYGFRHNEAGDRRFFFCSHNTPFPVPVPSPDGLDHHHVYYSANKLDPHVRFDRAACQVLAQIPKPFRGSALQLIIKEAREQGVTMVDKEFLDRFNEKRKAG